MGTDINQQITMQIQTSVLLSLAVSLVSAKLYLLNPESDEHYTVRIAKSGHAVSRGKLDSALPNDYNLGHLYFDRANEDDLQQLSEDVFSALNGRQVAELVLNRNLNVFGQRPKSKKLSKSANIRAHLRSCYASIRSLLGTMSPADLGVDLEQVVSAVPVEDYGEMNPATVLLSDTAVNSVEAFESILNLDSTTVETSLIETLGDDRKSLRLIKKIQKMVKKLLHKLTKISSRTRIFDIIHTLTEFLKKVPMLSDLLGPRLQKLSESLSSYINQLQTTITRAIHGAQEQQEALLPISEQAQAKKAPLRSIDNFLSFENDQDAHYGSEHEYARKEAVEGSTPIEYDTKPSQTPVATNTRRKPAHTQPSSSTFAGVRPVNRRTTTRRSKTTVLVENSTDSEEWSN